MNSKAIIWGTGGAGEKVYYKVSHLWQIVGFCDSNCEKWNQKFMGINIYAPEKLVEMPDCDIVIASTWYEEIIEKILAMGVEKERIFYNNPRSYVIQSLRGIKTDYQKKRMRILFVQSTPGIRIDKIASVLKNNGVYSDMAYLTTPPELCMGMQRTPYENIIPINDLREFVQYVNREDYDLVWSANEPDYLTTLLLNTKKIIIHDTADMMSLRGDINIEQMVHEYIANKKSHGNVYVTDLVSQIAKDKFDIGKKEVLILNNYVLREDKPKEYLQKKSSIDGEIHCVYEGGITSDEKHHRYYEKMFMAIARHHIHVHFYGRNNEYVNAMDKLSPYLHYEGCKDYERLQTELTQYDVGLVLLNITERNNIFLQTTFPNKIFEYLYAGLPVAVSNIEALIHFVQKYQIGEYLDFSNDIEKQIKHISEIKVERNFLENEKLTMDDQTEKIIDFFERIMEYTL